MVLDLIIKKSFDGYSAVIPSISGCETWSENEDDAVIKSLELLKFYLNLPADKKINVDKARNESEQIIYKLIFKK